MLPAKGRVRYEALNLKSEAVIMFYLISTIAYLKRGDRCVRRNGKMIIIKGKRNVYNENSALAPIHPLAVTHKVS
jgi:hypothetical protein